MNQISGYFKNQVPGFKIDAQFDVSENGFTAFFGRSGAGKSTLLRCIAGLTRAKDGYFKIQNQEWQNEKEGLFIPPHQRKIGWVPQDAFLFPHLNVLKNIEFGFQRINPSERKISLDAVIDAFSLEALLFRKTDSLSGGEKQRIALARALAISPKLFLFDEPLSSLDWISKKEISDYLKHMKREFKIPTFYISHDPQEVRDLCETVIYLENGKTTRSGPAEKILQEIFQASAEVPPRG